MRRPSGELEDFILNPNKDGFLKAVIPDRRTFPPGVDNPQSSLHGDLGPMTCGTLPSSSISHSTAKEKLTDDFSPRDLRSQNLPGVGLTGDMMESVATGQSDLRRTRMRIVALPDP
jgi:hypothetical protein